RGMVKRTAQKPRYKPTAQKAHVMETLHGAVELFSRCKRVIFTTTYCFPDVRKLFHLRVEHLILTVVYMQILGRRTPKLNPKVNYSADVSCCWCGIRQCIIRATR
ncbi:hypothetical protein L9F63_011972, partial [Diploptera punctata]